MLRPSICREYLVTSAPIHCASLNVPAVARVPVAIRLSEALVDITAELLGTNPQVIPLPYALEWAELTRTIDSGGGMHGS